MNALAVTMNCFCAVLFTGILKHNRMPCLEKGWAKSLL